MRYVSVEILTDAGHPTGMIRAGETIVVRASYRADERVKRPVFQVAIIDVDTGLVITTGNSMGTDVPAEVHGAGAIECRFTRLPLRPRQYVLRLSISDCDQLASYDVVTAGPRFAVTGHGSGVDGLADEDDGLVSLPYEFQHYGATAGVASPGGL